jgi:hypothetical protein
MTIQFKTDIRTIDTTMLLLMPRDESAKLPSRGQVMVRGTINEKSFTSPLEPDGQGSHWLKIDDSMKKTMGLSGADKVVVTMEVIKEWPEPVLPTDLATSIDKNPNVKQLWDDITPMARWDWLRWINSTKVPATRAHRIEVAFSKLQKGSRRPCCFNRTMCTDPDVSKSGVLLAPTSVS